MQNAGIVVVVSAPSGAGKSTLCDRLVDTLPNLEYSISCTTRPMRPGERDGIDYVFVAEKKFREMVRQKAFVEWARVHDHYYGTPKKFLEKSIRAGKDVILDIDVQGGMAIRKSFPQAVLVFIMTPTMAELEKRLRARNKDSDAVIRTRLRNARTELAFLPRYDYLIINDDLDTATAQLESVIIAEHRRLARLPRPVFTKKRKS